MQSAVAENRTALSSVVALDCTAVDIECTEVIDCTALNAGIGIFGSRIRILYRIVQKLPSVHIHFCGSCDNHRSAADLCRIGYSVGFCHCLCIGNLAVVLYCDIAIKVHGRPADDKQCSAVNF